MNRLGGERKTCELRAVGEMSGVWHSVGEMRLWLFEVLVCQLMGGPLWDCNRARQPIW